MPNVEHSRRAGERRVVVLCLALACLSGPLLAPRTAGAEAPEAATVLKVGRVRMTAPVEGRSSLLVPVRYPVELLGQPIELRLTLRRPGRGGAIGGWRLRARANGGELRRPEQRDRFTFVHRIALGPELTRQLEFGVGTGRHRGRARPLVQIDAGAVLDINRDGVPELDSPVRELQTLPRGDAGRQLCSSVPMVHTRPGKRVVLPLPRCGAPVRWRIVRPPDHGFARIRGGRLIYRSAPSFRGDDSLRLRQRVGGSAGVSMRLRPAPVEIRVLSHAGTVVRAIGDSVTAGFGYYNDGSLMPFASLLSCEPGEKFYDDACSSNSTNHSNEEGEVTYAPDYGLSNNVSWAAQWSNEHGVTNYENLAVSGSEPKTWLPGGQLYSTLKQMESEEPDDVLMTMGANPLLSEMLFGVDNMGCAIWSDLFGRYRECIEEAFEKVQLGARLKQLYEELVANTEATIYLMQYQLSIPSSALAYSVDQIAEMGALLNEEIASVAAEVGSPRLHMVTPPGPSDGPPWVISGDTGIHPSAAGYTQMAAQVPPP